MRYDAIPPGGGHPGSDYALMREQLLDRYNLDYAILNGEEAIEISTLANPHYASALARACNDWMLERWLPRDARFKGSLVVAPQDPVGAAQEIRRMGSHPDLVQVLVSSGAQRPYGDPFYHPIWEGLGFSMTRLSCASHPRGRTRYWTAMREHSTACRRAAHGASV
jgi:predicted TIM-barrel fold metal-dependent hydrolase